MWKGLPRALSAQYLLPAPAPGSLALAALVGHPHGQVSRRLCRETARPRAAADVEQEVHLAACRERGRSEPAGPAAPLDRARAARLGVRDLHDHEDRHGAGQEEICRPNRLSIARWILPGP